MFLEKLTSKNIVLGYVCYILVMLCFSCQTKTKNESKTTVDSSAVIAKPETIVISDSAALPLSKEILSVIKNENYTKLATYIKDSIRFSPYGYIDTVHNKKISVSQLLNYLASNKNEKLTWGTYDGSGETISLTANEYFQKFVYDVDFINAPNISLNKTLSHGNSLNNLDAVYKNCVYTELYFPGFDKKYGGMDWRSLKLVFKKDAGKLYLVAIIHDQWTS